MDNDWQWGNRGDLGHDDDEATDIERRYNVVISEKKKAIRDTSKKREIYQEAMQLGKELGEVWE